MADTYDIQADQGADLDLDFIWLDDFGVVKDLTGYSARMMIRKDVFDVNPLLSFTTPIGGLTISPTLGKTTLKITAAQTAALQVTALDLGVQNWRTSWVYDLELVDPAGLVTRLVQGRFNMNAEVTR